MKVDQHNIWIGTDSQYFLIPEGIELSSGDYLIEGLHGASVSVNLESILSYKTSEDSILEGLKNDYTDKVRAVRESLLTLNSFASKTGKFDEKSLQNLAKTEFDKLSTEQQEPLTFGKEIIEDFMNGLNDKNASPEEQLANFQKTMGKVPEVMKYFDEHNLELAAKDPEAWAKTIHDKMFGEQEEAKKAAYEKQLKKEVDESIARGLREAGIEPIDTSKDMEDPNDQL